MCLYVDALIYSGSNVSMIENFKKSMIVEFDMSNLDMMHYFLGFRSESICRWCFCFSKEICGRCS